MFTYSFATVIVVLVVSTHGHDCTKYSLTPSDQSIIDMMKHYLHTSRKADCPVTTSHQNIGVTYVRWGKKTCPENSEIVYTGQAGGNYYKNKGVVPTISVYPEILKMAKHTPMEIMHYMVPSMRYIPALNHPICLLVWAKRRFHVQYAGGMGKFLC
ncbi:uncharacterized protein LOC143079396 isoform X5 [Mytilus galloprovincialis]|uniref:uncharacterized protein LOC143079396 isoform X5 n=1 Tax=Mytilus galloprovincialis TaxID=29158 RepID=UPI003F7BB215